MSRPVALERFLVRRWERAVLDAPFDAARSSALDAAQLRLDAAEREAAHRGRCSILADLEAIARAVGAEG